MNKFIKHIEQKDIAYEFVKSLNGLLNLTDRELELLSIFIDISMDKKNKVGVDSIDSAKHRKIAMRSTGITKDNLCRYIKKFKSRKIFVRNGLKVYIINNAIIPIIIGGKTVQTTLILKINNNEIQ